MGFTRDKVTKERYKRARKEVKREVAKAKNDAYEELYQRLETKEGEMELFKIAKQRDIQGKDVHQARVIKNEDGEVLVEKQKVKQRWKEYFDNLLNQENPRERREIRTDGTERMIDEISVAEVRTAMRRMMALGPDEIPVEAWLCLGNRGVEFLTRLFNRLLRGGKMPDEWRKSVLVPFYKGKGDIKECGNYRGIKLTSHTMKLWERVIEARLRKGSEGGGTAVWVYAWKEYYYRRNIQSADAAGEVERRAEGDALCVCGSRKGL